MSDSQAKTGPRLSRFYRRYFKKHPQQSRSRSVVESVLVATLEKLVHTADGDSISLRDVAGRAGVGIGSLYDYFRDRDGLLAGVVAKVTEDNLRRLEAQLEASRNAPLREAVGQVIDVVFATYLDDVRVPRAVLRVAHRIGLMPILAESQATFAATLAKALRERDDVAVEDVDAAAYVVTNMAMGVVHTTIWAKAPPFTNERLRNQLVQACVVYLTSGASPLTS